MGRVLVRDQYSGEHWLEEQQLAYAPWRDCEVIRREEPQSEAVAEDKPASPDPGEDKPAKRKPAAE